jgi:hypothetical protein
MIPKLLQVNYQFGMVAFWLSVYNMENVTMLDTFLAMSSSSDPS